MTSSNLISNKRTITGNILCNPESLLASGIMLNSSPFILLIKYCFMRAPILLIKAAIFVIPYEKVLPASPLLNSLEINFVKWSDRLKNELWCTSNIVILTSERWTEDFDREIPIHEPRKRKQDLTDLVTSFLVLVK